MKRLVSFLLLALLLITFVSCEHNVYLDDKKDLPSDIWCVGPQQNGNFFKTANEAINFIISQGMTKSISVDENCTIHLLRHVLSEDSDAIAMYGKQYVLPEEYRKEITVPEHFEGTLCIDFGGYRYDFANNIDYFFIVKGGSEVYIYNGDSVIFKESRSPITNPALIVGTRTVTIDEHLIDDRRVGPENEAPAAVLVTEEGTLVITCDKEKRAQTGVGGTFTVNEGGVVKIEEGTVTIKDVLEVEKSDITITGGEIHNPHEIDDRISEAIPEENKKDVDRKIVHSPLKHFEAKQPTCLEDGNIEFWQCQNDDCLKLFADIDCTTEISLSQTRVSRLNHNLIHKDGTESTCTEHGHPKHWVCQSCGKFFKDASATKETTWEDLQLELKPHSFNNTVWSSDNTHHWHECSVCHEHEENIAHSSIQFVYDDDNHWKICSVCGSKFALGSHTWGEWEEHISGSVTHLIAECTICGAKKTATKPEYLVYDIGIGEAKLKAIEDTPCGDFYINGTIIENNAPITVSNSQVTAEFRPFINSNINFSPYCNVIHNGSMNQITTGTKDEKGNYKVSFTLTDKKEYGVNIQLNTEGGTQSITCYLRLI